MDVYEQKDAASDDEEEALEDVVFELEMGGIRIRPDTPWNRLKDSLGCSGGRHRERPWRNVVLGASAALIVLISALLLLLHYVSGGDSKTWAYEPNVLPDADYQGHPRQVRVPEGGGVVAADHHRCSAVGRDILQDGGNAIDAAVATALCEGVYNPSASGIGGGTLMTVRVRGETFSVVAREVAPRAASRDMFVAHPDEAQNGGKAVAVPLEILGLHAVWEKWGTHPWEELIAPAAEAAENGFEAHPYLVHSLSSPTTLAQMRADPALSAAFLVREASGEGEVTWRPPAVGELCCKRPALAATLRRVAADGHPRALYSGELAAGLVADIKAAGGIMTSADLVGAADHVSITPAHSAAALGATLYCPDLPSAAPALLLALKVLEALPEDGAEDLPEGVRWHRRVEAMKHLFAVRSAMGDPRAAAAATPPGPLAEAMGRLLEDAASDEYAAELAGMLTDEVTQDRSLYGLPWNAAEEQPEDGGTCHISIVDDNTETAVSLTTTINTSYGSKLLSSSTGILLNNQMDDFSIPGIPNAYGLHPSAANTPAAGGFKSPLSSMSPLIVVKDDAVQLVVGANGGPLILSTVFQVARDILVGGKEPLDALLQPRIHHQLYPDTAVLEALDWGHLEVSLGEDTVQELEARGHNVTRSPFPHGACQVVHRGTDGVLTAASDPRKDGAPESTA